VGLVDVYYANGVGDLGVFIEHLTFNQGFNSQKSQFYADLFCVPVGIIIAPRIGNNDLTMNEIFYKNDRVTLFRGNCLVISRE